MANNTKFSNVQLLAKCVETGKPNHFANVCRSSSSKGMHQIEAKAKDDDDDDNNNEQFFNIGCFLRTRGMTRLNLRSQVF